MCFRQFAAVLIQQYCSFFDSQSNIYVYVSQIVVCPFVLFLLAIVLSVLFRFTDSDYLPLVSSNSSYLFVSIYFTFIECESINKIIILLIFTSFSCYYMIKFIAVKASKIVSFNKSIEQIDVPIYEQKASTVMVNNSTNDNKTNNHCSPLLNGAH